jgi:hypothetical protein
MLELSTKMDSLEVYTHPIYPNLSDFDDSVDSNSLTGKLKDICPSLFNTLTTWEKETLNSSFTWLPGNSSTRPAPLHQHPLPAPTPEPHPTVLRVKPSSLSMIPPPKTFNKDTSQSPPTPISTPLPCLHY